MKLELRAAPHADHAAPGTPNRPTTSTSPAMADLGSADRSQCLSQMSPGEESMALPRGVSRLGYLP